jgi:hypothetical protein
MCFVLYTSTQGSVNAVSTCQGSEINSVRNVLDDFFVSVVSRLRAQQVNVIYRFVTMVY